MACTRRTRARAIQPHQRCPRPPGDLNCSLPQSVRATRLHRIKKVKIAANASVHLTGGETFERVRFIGFTNSETLKTHLPHELNGMVILEDEGKTRFLVRAKIIRLIVVEPDVKKV